MTMSMIVGKSMLWSIVACMVLAGIQGRLAHKATTTDVKTGVDIKKDNIESILANDKIVTQTKSMVVEASDFEKGVNQLEVNSGTESASIVIKRWDEYEYKSVFVVEGGNVVAHTYSWYLEQINSGKVVNLYVNGKIEKKDPEEMKIQTKKITVVQDTCIGNRNFTFSWEDDSHEIETLPDGYEESLTPETTIEQALYGFIIGRDIKYITSGFTNEFNRVAIINESLYSETNQSFRIQRAYTWPLLMQIISTQFEGEISYQLAEKIILRVEPSSSTLIFSVRRPKSSWKLNDFRAMNTIDLIVAQCSHPNFIDVFAYSANVFMDMVGVDLDNAKVKNALSSADVQLLKDYSLSYLYTKILDKLGVDY